MAAWKPTLSPLSGWLTRDNSEVSFAHDTLNPPPLHRSLPLPSPIVSSRMFWYETEAIERWQDR